MLTRRQRWLGIGAAAVVVATTAGGFLLSRCDRLDEPMQAARSYLATLQAGDAAAGFEQLCDERRANLTLDGYRLLLQQDANRLGTTIRSYRVFRASADVREGDETAVQFDLTTELGETRHEVTMRKERGRWRWCGARPVDQDGPGFTVRVP